MLFFSARCEWCCLFYYIRILFAIPCWNIPVLQLHHFISHSFLLCFTSVHFLRPSLHFHILFETLCCFHFIHSTQNMLNKMLKYCVAPFIFRVLPKTFEKSICRFAIIRDVLYFFFIFFFILNVSIHVIRLHDISSKSKLKLELLWN